MSSVKLQNDLLNAVTNKISKYSTLEIELVKLLGVSLEEAKNIVHSKQLLSLSQLVVIADAHTISLDALYLKKSEVVNFRFNAIDYNLHSLQDYMSAILAELQTMEVYGPRKLYYAARDFPIFTLFQFPELAAFKLYFLGKTVYDLKAFRTQKFDVHLIDNDLLKQGERAWRRYLKMPSIEIWSSDIVNTVLKQIYHAWRFGFFNSKDDALRVCDCLQELLVHIEVQAKEGRKFHPDNYPPVKENYFLYYNEVAISNNTLLFQAEDLNITFLVQNLLNYLVTDNLPFCIKTEAWLKNLQGQSTLISLQNEDLRSHFFQELKENVSYIAEKIKAE